MTEPDKNGIRPFPNTIRHLIPNFWNNFNFPDIVAAIAPRPLILTEGGLDRDLNLVRKAYEITGHPRIWKYIIILNSLILNRVLTWKHFLKELIGTNIMI